MAETRSPRREPFIGRPMPRLEDARLITGRGRYTDDVSYPGQAYAAFVRSPHPHAHIRDIDTAPARAMPGVLAVLTAADYAAAGGRGIGHFAVPADAHDVKKPFTHEWSGPPAFEHAQLPLAADTVRYIGEPVAVVVAETAALARDAAEHVAVDYDPLPAVTDVRAAIEPGAPLVHETAPRNLALDVAIGDAAAVEAAFASAHTVIAHRFRSQRIVNAQMEPRGAIGLFDEASGLVTVISGNQSANKLKNTLADCLGLPRDQVRAVTPDTGGAFGLRMNVYSEQVMVAVAARALKRPVKWLGDRHE